MKKRLLSALLCVAMLLTLPGCAGEGNVPSGETAPDSYTIAKASYPEQVQCPGWEDYTDKEAYYEDWSAWRNSVRTNTLDDSVADSLVPFLTASIPEFLTGTQGNEVYSPLNVYMALSMLAELTHGNTRAQIFQALGVSDLEALRENASALWRANYRADGTVTSLLASSVWLDKDVEFVQETMDTLAETYYASSYWGDMGSEEFSAALRDWLSEQTGGLLEDQAADLELTPETILALATTVYFRAKWNDEFNPDRTEPGEFQLLTAEGGSVTCDFMKSSQTNTYYWSDKFSAVSKGLGNGGKMWFILPDGDVPLSELLQDETTMEFLLADGEWEESKFLIVNLAVPKFDVSGEMSLSDGLKALGITDVFDPEVADFTPTTPQMDGIFLAQAEHAARVLIDEEGVEAAAYTVMMEAGSAMPPEEEVDFVLDRPFLFAITTESGLPLFVGVVKEPC